MKITYLGTAAAEGFPALFCNCQYCREARILKGKNIRTRSQALINDDLLIDFPADTYSHFLSNDIQGDIIQYLLVTHAHADHFYAGDLARRFGAFAHDMRVDRLKLYCGASVARLAEKTCDVEGYNVDIETLNPFDTVTLGDYTVTALPARHSSTCPLIYIIKKDKTILYAHDTGFFFDEVFDYIQNSGIVFDLVSLDCTNVDLPISDNGGHMGIDNVNRVVKRLQAMCAISEQTKVVINHFSHNSAPIHHRLEERVLDYGYIVSYDGLSIEL